jgi:hypothetical protein
MTREPLLVEFVGAAGSGKSIMCERLLEVLAARRIAFASFRTIAIRKHTPMAALIVMRAMLRALQLKPTTFRVYTNFAWTMAKHALRWRACAGMEGVIICDEGLLQRLRSFRRNSRETSMAALADKALRGAAVGRLVVILESDADTIFARRTARRKPDDLFTRESVADDVRLMRESIAMIDHLRKHGFHDMRVLRFNVTDENVDARVSEVSAAVEEAIRSP